MSRPHDGHRPFFPFGNPFRRIFPKGSYLSPKFLGLLNSFEQSLAERLKKLKPKDRSEVLSISWMRLAMKLLSETHKDIKTLITELQFPRTDWNETQMDLYLDNSIKLLDICIAFSSEMSRLNQGQLLLQCALHVLNAPNASQYPEQLVRARSSLDDWMQHIRARNPKLENCSIVLQELVESLHLAKVKNSSKGKVLMCAMHGVKVETIFVCSIFTAAFSGSAKPLMDLHVSDQFLWADAFRDVQTEVNAEVRRLFSNGNVTILKEVEVVETHVKKLNGISSNAVDPVETETLHNSILELGKSSERLSEELDFLAKDVESFFQIVLTGRDALLCNLRVSGSDSDPRQENNVGEQVVR